MSWLFSQALVAEFSEGNSLAGEPYAQLNVMPTQRPFWRNDKTMDVLSLSPFGVTWKPLTVNRGEELLMWFRAGFPVRTSAPPAKAKESKVSAPASGWRWPESSMKYDPASSLWKIRQFSLLGDSDVFSETWPRWGSMRDGECWALPTLVHRTKETGSGLLPTPTRATADKEVISSQKGRNLIAHAKGLWPTPTAANANQGFNVPDGKRGCTLVSAVKRPDLWPTPTVFGNYNRKGASKNSGDGLATFVKQYPTPKSSDHKGSVSLARARASESSRGVGLPEEITRQGEIGQLNPTWVEWLMNWPIGWTSLEAIDHAEFEYWKAASSKNVQGNLLPRMWFNIEAGAPSSGQKPKEQRTGKRDRFVFDLPSQETPADRTSGLRDLQPDIPAETVASEQAMRRFELQQGTRPPISRVAVGVNNRVGRLKAIGNGQVPQCAAEAWRILSADFN